MLVHFQFINATTYCSYQRLKQSFLIQEPYRYIEGMQNQPEHDSNLPTLMIMELNVKRHSSVLSHCRNMTAPLISRCVHSTDDAISLRAELLWGRYSVSCHTI